MSDINQVVIIGRLTRDAELSYTPSGTAACKFSIAINERRKAGDGWKDDVNYFDVVLWGQHGESLNKYLTKGKQIATTGKLTQDRWITKDGQNRSKVVITALTIQLLGGTAGGDSGGSGNNPPPSAAGAEEHFADEIPF